jgi:cold shock CspA family protein
MKSGSDVAQWVSPVPPRWHLPDERAGDLPSAGATQLTEHLAHDPLLKSIEQVWNANPLRDVIPLDWAGIVWALRTVWLRSLSRASAVPAVAELNAAVWRSSLDIWNEAGRRWWGQSSFDPAEAAKGGDKRFAAPEWHGNPLYRTLKEVYLLRATVEESGTVKWYNAMKGFGFIASDRGGKDIFVHASALDRAGIAGLTEGQRVVVDVVDGGKGPEAAGLRLI